MAEDNVTESLLEKIRSLSQKPGDNAELLRSLTSKLRSRLTSQDGNIRQTTMEKIWKQNNGDIFMLISLLEACRDINICNHLAGILRDIICLKSSTAQRKPIKKKHSIDINGDKNQDITIKSLNCSKKIISAAPEQISKNISLKKVANAARNAAITQSIEQNSTTTLIRILLQVQARKEPNNANTECLMYDILWVLSQLSQKDPKFSIKARMLGAVKPVHNILKTNINNNKILFPLLNLIKQLSKHPITTAILIRDGIVATYEKVLISLGYTPTARMRLCLDTVNYFSRNKNCCIQLVKVGIVHLLLRIFDRWDKFEGRMRLKMCTHILQTLQHVCIIKSGRRTISLKKHIQILHRFCTTCPDDDSFDRLLNRVCSVICLCVNNKSLPVQSTNPAIFCLSNLFMGDSVIDESDYKCDDFTGSSSDEENPIEDDETLSKGDSEGCSDSDSLLEGNMEENFKSSNEAIIHSQTNFIFQSSLRSVDELKRYNHFFKEFSRLQRQLRIVKTGSIIDDLGLNITSSNFNINKMEHTDLLQGLLANSSPSLILNLKSEMELFLKNDCHDKTIENSICTLKILRDIRSSSLAEVYTAIASQVKSIIPFVKVPYPSLHGSEAFCEPEYLNEVEKSTCRKKLIACMERAINPDSSLSEVVFDMDSLCSEETANKNIERPLGNTDVQKLTQRQYQHKKLEFESRFESGNLRKVIQTGPREYDLILMPDVNSNKRHLWFYFEVSNMTSGCSYVFNIVNCEKSDSQFNFGMKPVMYSVKEATLGRAGWVRAGSDICYYRNSYQCLKNKVPSKCYLTVTFTIDFPHSNDVCYLAYHFPYTYSQMMTKIWKWSRNLPESINFRAETLCNSLNGNEIPLLTITSQETLNNPIQEREIVFLTSRVHPGESNSSWVMEGTLRYLLEQSVSAERLRSSYVFKIVPMLNIEGVINGCYRCGLTNEDLNRRWSKPSPILHPDIYHTKGLLEYMSRVLRKPASVYCDYHGHSRKKNVFLYGCSPTQSWCSRDRDLANPDAPLNYLCLPAAMQRCCPAFSLSSCNFRIERERESTARVSVWRQLGVQLSYTLETSFCGFDQGPYKGLQLNTRHLKEIGKDLCIALAALKETSPNDLYLTTDENGRNNAADSDDSSTDSMLLLSETEDDID